MQEPEPRLPPDDPEPEPLGSYLRAADFLNISNVDTFLS